MDTVFSDISDGGRKYTIVFAFEKAINVMQMKKFQAISICTFIFYALLCFLFMYYMYISNILPIKQFADMFGISVKGFNFEYLKKSIKELVDNNYRIENQLKNQRLDISKLIIKKLLIGGSSAEYANMLDEYGMGFKFKNFLVIIIGFYSDVNNTTVDESIILEKFKDNIETMLNDENGFVYVVNDKARIVGLYNTAHNDSEITKIVSRKIAYIVNYMGSKYDFVASAAISKVHSGYNEIVMCYSEAVETMEQCGLNNQPSIIMYEDIEKDRKYVFTISQENELLIAIKNCDEEGAKKIIDDCLISVNEENVVLYRQMLVGILYALIKIAKTITNNNYNSEKLINSMQNIDDYENIHSVCISEIEEMCDRVKSTTEHNNNYLAEYVKNYITDNYDNSEISIEDLCQSIHYSTTYINNIFKKFYNTSFSEYLSRYRIDMASDFIRAGYTSIETAKKTGFTNVRTFNRAFKKHTGLTPSQYKRLHFKDNE